MSLLLDEDADVLQAALSFLDAEDGGAEPASAMMATNESLAPPPRPQTSSDGSAQPRQINPRKKRNSNPNRAREEQHRELLELRSQVPRLEKLLLSLQQERAAKRAHEVATAPTEVLALRDSWRALVEHEKQTRVRAEQENARLRELVREQAEMMQNRVHQLVPKRQEDPRGVEPWPDPGRFRPLYPVPISADDIAVLHELAAGLDAVFHQVKDEVPVGFAALGASDVPMRMFTNGEHRIITDKAFPFEVQTTGAAAWQFFAYVMERQTARPCYQAQSATKTAGLTAGDTIVESFGAGVCQGDQKGECRVRQAIRRYLSARRVVIVWRAFVDLVNYAGEFVENARFEEKGALVIEPQKALTNEGKVTSLVRTWQSMVPWQPSDRPRDAAQDERLQKFMNFVVNVCKPGRAMLSMESALSVHVNRRTPVG